MPKIEIKAAGNTHTGHVREVNEDALLMAPELGMYGVFDGMGGHSAGDVASSKAREVVHEFVRAHKANVQPAELLKAALDAASAAVNGEAKRVRDRHGMGTTAVIMLEVAESKFLIAHVGDSRAYLFRDRRLTQITRDHTVVAELLANGAITPEDALHHPYKSVLSRNIGAKPAARSELNNVELQPGDRLLLCSDGLNGFTSVEAMEQVLGGVEDPDVATAELIALALAGGGGDNVTVVIVEAGARVVPRSTLIIRTTGATEWWARRQLFLNAVAERGLAQSPICAVLSPHEALEIVAGNLCEAVYHDLEQTTGINVWTYAQNLAKGWFDQGGDYGAIRNLMDMLRGGAAAVVGDIANEGGQTLARNLEIAVTRSLIVAEMAIGGLVAEQLRVIEKEMIALRSQRQRQQTITDHPTTPYMSSVKVDPPSPQVAAALEAARDEALAELERRGAKAGASDCLNYAHDAATQVAAVSDAAFSARDLYGARPLEEKSLAPLFDALDQARSVHLYIVRAVDVATDVKVAALRRAVVAHEALVRAVAGLVVESGHPVSDALHSAAEETGRLRAKLGRGEARIAELDRELIHRVEATPEPATSSKKTLFDVTSAQLAKGKRKPKPRTRKPRSTQIGHASVVSDFGSDADDAENADQPDGGTEVDRDPFGKRK